MNDVTNMGRAMILILVLTGIFLLCTTITQADKNNPPVNLLKNGGFEDLLAKPWGTGLYSEGRPVWWNSGGCQSEINLDEVVKKSGLVSLHITNPTPHHPNAYGTMAQHVAIRPNLRYRITLWAKGGNLASAGTIQIIIDPAWKIRPISLPSGTFSWRKFDGIFSLPDESFDFRILCQDQGEAWIDDIEITPLDGSFSG